jgi:squalene-hopene/tetraprenyl-beta-curcumene cyclase
MLAAQVADGTWGDTQGGRYAFFRRYEQTLFAALGIAAAPEGYSEQEAAQACLDRIRKFIHSQRPPHPYAQGMLLWASSAVADLATAAEREKAVDAILALQRSDGGWALRRMLADDPKQPSGKFAGELPSDGYGTGFALFTLRQGGIAATDRRLQAGVAWLKANQRASGRWFHPSLSDRPNHVLSNSGTAWAVLGLQACDALAATAAGDR